MATNTFLNYVASCTDATQTTVYTIPSATTSVILGCNLANTGAADITVDVQLANKYVIKGVTIPVGNALGILEGKMIAEAGHVLTVQSDATGGDCDIIVSVLEQA